MWPQSLPGDVAGAHAELGPDSALWGPLDTAAWFLELSVYHPTSAQDQRSQAHLGPMGTLSDLREVQQSCEG